MRNQASPMTTHHRCAEREACEYPKNRLWHVSDFDEFFGPGILDLPQPEKDYWRLRYVTYSRRSLAEVYPNIHAGFSPYTDDDGDRLRPSSPGSSFSDGESSPDEEKISEFNTSPGDGNSPTGSQGPRGTKRRGSTAGPAESKRPKPLGDSVYTTRQRGQSATDPIIQSYPSDSNDERDSNDLPCSTPKKRFLKRTGPTRRCRSTRTRTHPQPNPPSFHHSSASPPQKPKAGVTLGLIWRSTARAQTQGGIAKDGLLHPEWRGSSRLRYRRLADAEMTEDEGDGVALRRMKRMRKMDYFEVGDEVRWEGRDGGRGCSIMNRENVG